MHFGRKSRRVMKRTNIEIVLEETKEKERGKKEMIERKFVAQKIKEFQIEEYISEFGKRRTLAYKDGQDSSWRKDSNLSFKNRTDCRKKRAEHKTTDKDVKRNLTLKILR